MINSMQLQPTSLEKYCPTITYDFSIAHVAHTHLVDLLVITFHGRYRDGSEGRPDAGLIQGGIRTGIAVFDPFKLIIDLSDLEYALGDNLSLLIDESEWIKTAYVVGDKCRHALSTLYFGARSTKDIVDHQLFFDSFDLALKKLQQG